MRIRRPRGLTLRTKLLLSFAGAGLLVVALLVAGDLIMRDAAARMEASLTAQVRPLARLNRLQSELSRIRVLEIELPRLTDLFAVSDQLELLRSERSAFDRDLAAFAAEQPAEAGRLEEYWRRYQDDLESIARQAGAMQLDAVQRISTYESAGRFKAIARVLKQRATDTEHEADEAFRQAIAQQGTLRVLLMGTSAFGLIVFAAWLLLLVRSVTRRISGLRDAAARIAEGRDDAPIALRGRDELADLGAAFNVMRDRVRSREQALRSAHDELESRVASRTHELNLANEMLAHQAQYDGLTELPNRLLAMDRLAQALRVARRESTKVVLIFLDLDDFKKVNDSLGHAAGDALLVQAARRLRKAVRDEDTVARLGGDEFLVILGGAHEAEDGEAVADKILQAFAPSFSIGESEVVVSPSLGLAVYPEDGDDASLLLRNADLAMYDAKESGRNTYRYFNPQVHDRSVQRLGIERRLRGAAARGEFELLYQPLVAAAGRRLVGAEALLRWRDADGTLMAPDQFIAVAEHTGLIVEIGDWVLRTACAQLRAWQALGFSELQMAVNVSPRQFRGERLVASVRECLQGLPAHCLQIEVTEGLFIRNPPEVRATLETLSRLGVRLAMDDFGTGYSSLSYLKRFPFDALKIDREFVRDVADDLDDRALVIAAIRMGKGLGLSVTAEGVETDEQLAFLLAQECDVVQGYLFDRPLAAAVFEARWLQQPVLRQVS